MRKRGDTVLYLVSWDDDGIVKVGISNRRRWRSFPNARLVLALPFAGAIACYDLEAAFHHQRPWPRAFASGAAAMPYLGGRGHGYLECYRTTADDALDRIASQCASRCGVTVPHHITTSRSYGRTDGRTNGEAS